MGKVIREAYEIAARELRSCYAAEGILAGRRQYEDHWARDSFYASWGALCLKDYGIVKKNLALFLSYQAADGQIPMRVGEYFIGLKLLGVRGKAKQDARFTQDKISTRPTDQNSLLLITALAYAQAACDDDFVHTHISRLIAAAEWNGAQDADHDGLIEEGPCATWADSLRKRGTVLYTNALYCESARCAAELCRIAGKHDEAVRYRSLHARLQAQIRKGFWNGEHYGDWIDTRRAGFFSTDGNVLAVLFGIADTEEAASVESAIKRYRINEPLPSRTNHPHYPLSLIHWINILGGVADYHNGMCWLWLGCLDAVAKQKLGMRKEALDVLTRIAEVIVRDKGVFEVYGRDRMPIRRLLYRSEQPFAWSAGLFIYATHAQGMASKTREE